MQVTAEPNTTGAVLVGGAPSSGTTLLSLMLDAHPRIFCGPEICLFSHPAFFRGELRAFVERVRTWFHGARFDREDPLELFAGGYCPYALLYEDNLRYYGLDTQRMLALLTEAEGCDELASRFFGPHLERAGKSVWAEKSPANIYAFAAFLERFPRGRALCIVRDAPDVVHSLERRGFGFRRALSVWLLETALAASFSGHPRVLRVRYEDLVSSPRETIAAFLDFLGVEPAVDRVLRYWEESERARKDPSAGGMPSWTRSPLLPPSPETIGRGRRELAPEKLAAIGAAVIHDPPPGLEALASSSASELLSRLGYDPLPSHGVDPDRLLRLVASQRLFVRGDSGASGRRFQERFVTCDAAALGAAGALDERWLRRLAESDELVARSLLGEAAIVRDRDRARERKLETRERELLDELARVEAARAAAEAARSRAEANYTKILEQHDALCATVYGGTGTPRAAPAQADSPEPRGEARGLRPETRSGARKIRKR